MDGETVKYTHCPNCDTKREFIPNATYECKECGKRFYVKLNENESYLSSSEKSDFRYPQIIDIILLILFLVAFIIWDIDLFDWLDLEQYWPIVYLILAISAGWAFSIALKKNDNRMCLFTFVMGASFLLKFILSFN